MNAPLEAFVRQAALREAGSAGREVVLLPGQWWFGAGARSIRTLLGSCVAVSLWHPRLRLGGMCHYVLPSRHRRLHLALDGRYGDEAIELLVSALRAAGTGPGDYEARLWGGADLYGEGGAPVTKIGTRNAARGRWLLRQHGFHLLQLDVGGSMHRTVELGMATGGVAMRLGSPPPAP